MINQKNQEDLEREDEIREAFNIFDKNKSNSLSVDELSSVFRSLGYNFSNEDIQAMVKELNKGDLKELAFEDFKELLMLQEEKAKNGEDDLRDAFEVFDRDANGYISIEELNLVAKSLGENISEEDLKGMIQWATNNGGDQVSLKDFVETYLQK